MTEPSNETIKKSERFVNLIKQFVKFGLVGASNTLISLSIYYLFVLINQRLYMLGYVVGFIISVLNAYYWHNKYVFTKTTSGHLIPIIKTYASYGLTFLLESILLFVMVNYLHISTMIAPLINLLINIPLNFLLNKFWVFK